MRKPVNNLPTRNPNLATGNGAIPIAMLRQIALWGLAGAFTLALATACSDSNANFSVNDGGPSQGADSAVSGPCNPAGATRCSGGEHRRCENGVWTTVDFCAKSEICADDLGCVACIPTSTTTCEGGNVHTCNADGTVGALVQECLTEACVNGGCGQNNCSAESQLIYLVDHNYNLVSFNPRNDAHTFKKIAQITCAAKPSWPDWASDNHATPFSMSVDRSGKAWVHYTSGEIFWVNIKSGACLPTQFVPGYRGYQLFGMGFVSESAGSNKEQLFLFGGAVGQLKSGTLAMIEPADLKLDTIGSLQLKDGTPELTGTGNGKLFGFFPGAQAFVAEIDKTNGRYLKEWPVGDFSEVQAWAFAHWGGRFYIFTSLAGEDRSQVRRFDPASGKVEVVAEAPYVITGAGVSTCAPVIN